MPITAKQAVERNFLRNKWQAEQERMDEAQNRLDLYMDDYEDIVRAKMKELFTRENYDRMKYHVNQSQNIMKRVIKEISIIYKAEAQRSLNKDSPRYEEIKDEVNMDLKLKKVNRYTNLLNECLVKIGIRGGRIVYDIITPNVCMVVQNEEDPTQADAIIYMVTWVNTPGNKDIEYHYWSIEGDYFIFDESFKLKRIEYEDNSPYRDKKGSYILPFVTFHREEPDSTFWDQDSCRDLYNAALMTGIKMTLFDYYFKTCSFKQVYLIGDTEDMPQDQVMDPLTALSVPPAEGAEIGTLDIQVNLDQLKNALVYQINSLINNYGISADQWTLSISEMSGIALRIRNMPLIEAREEQIPLYRKYERELFEKTRVVNNAWPRIFKKIPDNAEFSADFGDITFPEDPEVRFKYRTKLLQSGLISLGQYYQDFNPDVKDEKDAEKMIIDNLKKLKEIKEKNPELDELLNAILGTEPAAKAGGGEEGGEEE